VKSIGLFAGIGGIEEGIRRAGIQVESLCEIDPTAQAVLNRRFPEARILKDVRRIKRLPRVDLLTAGFPCQNLSQAGMTEGIRGEESGLVKEIFRLLSKRGNTPRWVLLENVPFMLQLDKGKAMTFITASLEELGYTWAYRIIDTRAFGLPQRRRRVWILASRTDDPRGVLLSEDIGTPASGTYRSLSACGFYWTEGTRGLGWALDAIPALKPGSKVSIPSPPGIWMPLERRIVLPDVRDAERLQGFPTDWTKPAAHRGENLKRRRWRLIGNAVSVPVARWIGQQILKAHGHEASLDSRLTHREPWGNAGWGRKGIRYQTRVSEWPVRMEYQHLHEFLRYPVTLLSARATDGFLRRACASKLRFPAGFLEDVAYHLSRMRKAAA
jgi:DNA (cytosine-5)-methyltransferase 1